MKLKPSFQTKTPVGFLVKIRFVLSLTLSAYTYKNLFQSCIKFERDSILPGWIYLYTDLAVLSPFYQDLGPTFSSQYKPFCLDPLHASLKI